MKLSYLLNKPVLNVLIFLILISAKPNQFRLRIRVNGETVTVASVKICHKGGIIIFSQ